MVRVFNRDNAAHTGRKFLTRCNGNLLRRHKSLRHEQQSGAYAIKQRRRKPVRVRFVLHGIAHPETRVTGPRQVNGRKTGNLGTRSDPQHGLRRNILQQAFGTQPVQNH